MMTIGIVGLGHLGKIHLKLLKAIPEYTVNGIYDIDTALTTALAHEYNVKPCADYDELLHHNEAISIVTPTPSHFELAVKAIKQNKHVFIEKPATSDPEDTQKLIKLAREAGVCVQVGHVERFNPAFTAVKDQIKAPYFFDVQRMATYNVRGTDVSVVLDLMIHDIDLIVSTVKSKIKKITATGSFIISKTPDFANARLEFENGCVANLTVNRAAVINKREMAVFQENMYMTIDLLHKTAVINQLEPVTKGEMVDHQNIKITSVNPEIKPVNSIGQELEDFYNSITQKLPVKVSLADAEAALLVAQEIDLQINALNK
jgi:predicted dehydrogenase